MITFELAQSTDNNQLQNLLNKTAMDGWVQITLKKEPHFFDAVSVGHPFHETVIGRDSETGSIIACGSRAIKAAYVNGIPQDIGYLSNLRIASPWQRTMTLVRGYRFLRTLHYRKNVPLYLTTIIEDNAYAKQILTSERAGLPAYKDYGAFHTFLIPIIKEGFSAPSGLVVRKAALESFDEVISFINGEGLKKQFYPVYTKEHFMSSNQFLRDLNIEHVYVAYDNNAIIGVIGAWDQTAFKQIVTDKYNNLVRYTYPLYNMWAHMRGTPPLPRAGETLRCLYICMVAIKNNNTDILRVLLNQCMIDMHSRQINYCLIGFHEKDPLMNALASIKKIALKSRLFVVYWEDGEKAVESLDSRIPYLELAVL